MTKLIINADDFGYSRGVNHGILDAYQNGVVTSATLMANMPGAAHAAALAKENPGLGVGIHLVLTCGYPVHENVPSLINESGKFHRLHDIAQIADIMDIEKELNRQFDKFLSFGLKPTHIDSHHHVHGLEKVFPIVEKLALKYRLPIRMLAADAKHTVNSVIQTVQYFNSDFYGDHLTVENTIELLEKVLPYETAEIMCHPAFIDEDLLTGSSYALHRARELSILTDLALRGAILEKKIELVTYGKVFKQSFV